MPEKDPGTGELKEAEKGLRVILPPRDDAPPVVEPREQTFDLPAASRPPDTSAVLGEDAAAPAMRGDHLDAVAGQQ
jgi:hypothetical protein